MAKAKSGGGITSNKVVQSRGVVSGAKAKGVSPQAASRIGIRTVATTGVAKVPGPIAKPLGNELAKNVGKGGPGAGRTVHPSGSQSRTSASTPMTSADGWPWTKGN